MDDPSEVVVWSETSEPIPLQRQATSSNCPNWGHCSHGWVATDESNWISSYPAGAISSISSHGFLLLQPVFFGHSWCKISRVGCPNCVGLGISFCQDFVEKHNQSAYESYVEVWWKQFPPFSSCPKKPLAVWACLRLQVGSRGWEPQRWRIHAASYEWRQLVSTWDVSLPFAGLPWLYFAAEVLIISPPSLPISPGKQSSEKGTWTRHVGVVAAWRHHGSIPRPECLVIERRMGDDSLALNVHPKVVPCQQESGGNIFWMGWQMAHPSGLLERLCCCEDFFKCILWCCSVSFYHKKVSLHKFRKFQACNDWPCQSSSFRWAFNHGNLQFSCQPGWTLNIGVSEVQEQLMSKAPSVFLCQTQFHLTNFRIFSVEASFIWK